MGKKDGYSGESPKDRAINLMDKFISRNDRRNTHKEVLPARRKSADVPFNLWPTKDQIEYMENKTDDQLFAESYPSYSYWYNAVKKASCVYHITFTDLTSKYKLELLELFNNNTSVKSAITFLQKRGIY
jgi:Rad3-related DNA helicase